jgi:hypothetical protein
MNNIFKIVFLLFLFIVSNTYCYSQAANKDGFIITLTSDTLLGTISLDSKDCPNNCMFKENNKQEVRSFAANQIKAFGFIDGPYYIAKNFIMDGKEHIGFVEYLYAGKVSLYKFTINNIDYYLLEKENEKPVFMHNDEVGSHINNEEDDDNIQIITRAPKKRGTPSFDYKQKMQKELTGYPEIYSQIELTKYNTKSIIKTIENYNKLASPSKSNINYYKIYSKSSFIISPVIAFKYKNSSSDISQTFAIKSEKVKPIPFIGVCFNHNDNNYKPKFSFQYYFLLGYEQLDLKGIYSNRLINFNRKSFQIDNSIGITYELKIKSITPFISIGLTGNYNYILHEENGIKYLYYYNSDYSLAKYSYGYYYGIGFKFKIVKNNFFKLSIRPENTFQPSDAEYYNLDQKGIGIYLETIF